MATYLAGKTGWFKSGNSNYSMREWKLDGTVGEVEITNFLSAGYQEFIAGLIGARITARGPYDAALQVDIAGNTSFTLNLGLGGNYYAGVSAILTRVGPSTSVDRSGEVDLEFRVTGTFNTNFAAAS